MNHTFVYYRDWLQLKSCFRRIERIADRSGIRLEQLHEYSRPFTETVNDTTARLAITRMHIYRTETSEVVES
jgi:hypothetical protein